MSNKLPVLSIAFVTGELIEPAGLPVLKVYRTEDSYVLGEGTELVILANFLLTKRGIIYRRYLKFLLLRKTINFQE